MSAADELVRYMDKLAECSMQKASLLEQKRELLAESDALRAKLRQAEGEAIERARLKIREECDACDNGVFEWDGHDATECEYCGRPMAVLSRMRAAIREEKP